MTRTSRDDRMASWLRAHPVVAVVLIGLAWHAALYLVAEQLLPPLAPDWFPDLGATLVNLILSCLTLAVLARLGWLRVAGVTTVGRLDRWWYVAPMALVALGYLAQGVEGSAAELGRGLVWLVVGVGLSEELYSRALSLHAASRLAPWVRCAVVGAVFGVGHLDNWLFFGKSLDDTVAQIGTAATYGFVLAALRLVIGSIWPLVLVHGLDDWAQIMSPGKAPDWWAFGVVQAVHLGYGAWLLRRPEAVERPAQPASTEAAASA